MPSSFKYNSLPRALVIGDQNATSPVFQVIIRLPRHLNISQRMNHVVRSDVTQLVCHGFITQSTNQAISRPMACNYERFIFVTLVSGWEIHLHRLQIITLEKLIKKERLKRFNRFKDKNTCWDSIYRYTSVNWSWLCMLRGLIYNACQLQSSHVLMRQTVNKHQHFEACLQFLTSKCFILKFAFLMNLINWHQ